MSRRKRQATKSLFVDLENDYNIMFGTGPAYAGKNCFSDIIWSKFETLTYGMTKLTCLIVNISDT